MDICLIFSRGLSTSVLLRKEEKKEENKDDAENSTAEEIPTQKKGWFNKLLNVRTIAPSKESHAKSLSSKEVLYEVMCK